LRSPDAAREREPAALMPAGAGPIPANGATGSRPIRDWERGIFT
jgi:hypothetical protein